MISTAVILAGGLGTRLRAAVPDLPKPMAPVNGRPFLAWQIDYWMAQGIRRFVLSVGYRRNSIVDYFGTSYRGAEIDYAVEEAPLGTGGGLLLALERLSDVDTFLLLNGDTFFEVPIAHVAKFHAERSSDWTFCLFRADEAGRYMGMEVREDGGIASLRSGDSQPGRLANGGVYVVQRQILSSREWPKSKLSLEDDLLPALLAGGARFFGCQCSGRFIDIGIPEDYRRCAELLPA